MVRMTVIRPQFIEGFKSWILKSGLLTTRERKTIKINLRIKHLRTESGEDE